MKCYRIALCILISISSSAYSMKLAFKVPETMACILANDAKQSVEFYLPGDMWHYIVSASRRNPVMHVCKFLWQFASRHNEENLLIDPSFTYLSLNDATRLLARSVEHSKTAQVNSLLGYIMQKHGVNPVNLSRFGIPIYSYATNKDTKQEMIALFQKFHKEPLIRYRTSLDSMLISATRTGDEKRLAQELASIASLKKENPEECEKLIYDAACHAAAEDHVDCLKLLLIYITDDNSKQTLFKHAVINGNVACAELLLHTWPDLSEQDTNNTKSQKNHEPCLIEYAISVGKSNMVRLLLKYGTDQIKFNATRSHPLHEACIHNRGDIIELLLEELGKEKKNSLLIRSAKLYHACAVGDIEYIRKQLTADIAADQILFPYHKTVLHVAVESQQEKMVSFLIAQKHARDPVDTLGATPLMLAAESGNLSIVKMLHEAGANINAQDPNGYSCIMAAAKNNHLPIVQYLVENRADIMAKDKNQFSALHHAALGKGTDKIITYLIRNGIPINDTGDIPPNFRVPAIQVAIGYKHFSNVKTLIELGADITMNDHLCIRVACTENEIEITKLLLNAYEKLGTSLRNSHDLSDLFIMRSAIKNNCLKAVQTLLDADALITDAMIGYAHELGRQEIEELLRKTQKERAGTSL